MVKRAVASTQSLKDGELLRIAPDNLTFDLENPRLIDSGVHRFTSEAELISHLWSTMAVEELCLSILSQGYFDYEPLIAIGDRAPYTVIEGNRRLAAVKILRSDALRAELKTELPKPSELVTKDTDALPVVLTTRKDAWQYIGFKHVNGAKPWGALAKATYIARVHNDFNVALDDIPRMIGDTHATVRRLYRGLMVLEQARDDDLFDFDDIFGARLYFSHLYTGLGYPGIQTFLGLKEDSGYTPKPIKGAANKKNLGFLCLWLFGSKSAEQPPLIQSQNPDLKRLDEALQTEAGHDALIAGYHLDAAFEASIGDERRFREALLQAKMYLEVAAGKVHSGFDVKSDQHQTAKSVVSLAEGVLNAIENIRGAAKKSSRRS